MNEGELFIKQVQRLSDETALDLLKADVMLASPMNAIPLEQIRGDIARKGHQIERIIALDAEAGRLFFQDSQNNHLFAEFADASHGWHLHRIGYQREVQKEYDTQDLAPEPLMKRETYDPKNLDAEPRDRVVNRHDEQDADVSIGARPQGNPGTYADAKPDMTEHEHDVPSDDDQKWPTIEDGLYKLDGILNRSHEEGHEESGGEDEEALLASEMKKKK